MKQSKEEAILRFKSELGRTNREQPQVSPAAQHHQIEFYKEVQGDFERAEAVFHKEGLTPGSPQAKKQQIFSIKLVLPHDSAALERLNHAK